MGRTRPTSKFLYRGRYGVFLPMCLTSGDTNQAPAPRGVLSSDDEESDTAAPFPRRPDATSSQVSSCHLTQNSRPTSIQRKSPTPEQEPLTNWPYWCVWCKTGAPPAVPERYTRELRQLFPTNDVHILACMGVLHDLHLQVLARIRAAQRRDFLLSFVPNKYTQLKALEMSDVLDKFGEEHEDEGFPGGLIQLVCSKSSQSSLHLLD